MRAPQLPDTPTIEEAGLPGYVVTSWQGLFGPAGMPADVVARIQKGFDVVFKSEAALKRFADLGTTPAPTSAAAHAAFMAEQEKIWSAVFKSANLTPQ